MKSWALAVALLMASSSFVVKARRLSSSSQSTAAAAKSSYDHLTTFRITPAHHQQQRRLEEETPQQEEGHAQQVDALYQGYGEHFVDLWCGTPPQRQTLIINTGGHGTAFPCSSCHADCGQGYHTDSYYKESNSLTFHQLTCDECMLGKCTAPNDPSRHGHCAFGLAYVEGSSWLATEVKDHCYIGGLHNKPVSIIAQQQQAKQHEDDDDDDMDPAHAADLGFDLNFGCQTMITGLFQTQLADGILAMDNSPNSYWHQMYMAGQISQELFSLCYARQPHADRNGTEAGAMTLGGSDDRLHLRPMVFSKHEDVWGLNYGVLLRKIHLRAGGGGDSARSSNSSLSITTLAVEPEVLNQGGVIIESGTTNTYMTQQMAGPFKQAFKELTGMEYDNDKALDWTKEQIQQLPTILFQFQGAEQLNKKVLQEEGQDVANLAAAMDPDHPYDVIVAMPPNHYMQYDSLNAVYYPRFYMSENPSGVSTLGANVMMGHDVLFDAKNHRIGWAESNCDYSHQMANLGFDFWGKTWGGKTTNARENSNSNAASSSTSTTTSSPPPPAYTAGSSSSSSSSSSRSAGWATTRVSLIFGACFFAMVLLLRRQDGRLGELARRATGGGGSGYYRRTLMANGDEVMGNDSELELQVSVGDTLQLS